MSYTFQVALSEFPQFGPFLSNLSYSDLRCAELVDDKGTPVPLQDFPNQPWPVRLLHLFRDQISVRGIEVDAKQGSMSVRFMTLSAPEDYELGFKLLEALAANSNNTINAEEGQKVSAQELRTRFDANWMRQQIESGARVTIAMAAEGKDIAIPCIRRDVHFGRRLLKELTDGGPRETFQERLIEKLRRVQFPGPNWYAARIMEVQNKNGGKKVTCSVMTPQVSYLFQPVEWIMVEAKRDVYMYLPYNELPSAAGDHFSFIDEKQVLVRAFNDGEWQQFVTRVEPLQGYPFGGDKSVPKRKWWQIFR